MPKIARLKLEEVQEGMLRPQDKLTPPCHLCADPHVGAHEVCYSVLRGAFYLHANLGALVFVLDPEVGPVDLIKLPNGSRALLLDFQNKASAFAVEEGCMVHAMDQIDWSVDHDPEDHGY